ncbi:MAG TPA: hypothetical protein VJ782_07220, partial [Aeromicrobium sp.]|nr:hypothetical protein [Aeromicrobium sp.]
FLSDPSPVAACVGDTHLGWAVARTRGGIAEGRVVEVMDTMGSGIRVRLEGVSRVLGRPPVASQTTLMMGDVCDQSADPGDTVWLLYDVKDFDEPTGHAVAFVVEGSDAVPRDEVLAALAAMPETDTVAPQPEWAGHTAFVGFLCVWLLSFLASARRFNERR